MSGECEVCGKERADLIECADCGRSVCEDCTDGLSYSCESCYQDSTYCCEDCTPSWRGRHGEDDE